MNDKTLDGVMEALRQAYDQRDALAAERDGAIQAGADVAKRCAQAWHDNAKLTDRIAALEAAQCKHHIAATMQLPCTACGRDWRAHSQAETKS